MKILIESLQDTEFYLRSTEIVESIIEEFGENFYNTHSSQEVCNFVLDQAVLESDNPDLIGLAQVIVCKANGSDIDFIKENHTVIQYNGSWYDYCAQKFNDSFNGLITYANLPVVQRFIMSDEQVTDKLSTVKGYVLLGY